MKTERNILFAFILNLTFSIFEFFGGLFTGSVAIISDAVHDIGDAASIGLAFFLEKKSRHTPDEKYTYGYGGYSVVGGLLTTLILLLGSLGVIYNAVVRIIHPRAINYDGMIIFAILGVCINLGAAFLTRGDDSIGQKAVNLHMLEDVLGWIVVLVGAVVMRFTNLTVIDPLMSIGVSAFILINAVKNFTQILSLLLCKTPDGVDVGELCEHVKEIDGVADVHHVHVWSLDGHNNCATMHVVATKNDHEIKEQIRRELAEHGIGHVTIEFEDVNEHCHEITCHNPNQHGHHGHHHGHHHH